MPPQGFKASQPCHCGSGKKYRDCHALKDQQRRTFVRNAKKALVWVAAVGVGGALVYVLSQNTGIAYNEDRIAAVNFSGLDAAQKRKALVAANAARCNCGCGMTLAQCVSTDSTCPIRVDNIARIKDMVADAMHE
jgi:hypothetical protein